MGLRAVTLAFIAAGLATQVGCTPVQPPPSDACCDPLEEPGVGDNPICVEGATCCADGTWQCNKGDGNSGCDADCPAGSCTIAREEAACGADAFCMLDLGECQSDDAIGRCTPRPEACITLFAPVCGCDGFTYGNECSAWAAGVNVRSAGPCT